MIGLFANEKHAITNEIDVKKIEQIIDKIKYINDNLCHYVIKLYYEYSDIISENNVKDINEELTMQEVRAAAEAGAVFAVMKQPRKEPETKEEVKPTPPRKALLDRAGRGSWTLER